MNRSDEKLRPLPVQDPYSGASVDLAPLLWVVHEYLDGFDHAAIRLTALIEDLISSDCRFIHDDPARFREYMFDLKMLRRALAATRTGHKPSC